MILVFGGTTEGRELAELLLSRGYDIKLSVVSDIGYDIGKEFIKGNPSIIKGRMDKYGMAELIMRDQVEIVIDATHPFATEVTLNIEKASIMTGVYNFRFQREKIKVDSDDLISTVADLDGAVKRVKKAKGKIFLAIGSKHVDLFMKAVDDPRNAIVRILPGETSLKRCLDAGLSRENIIQARGPFSKADNIKILKSFKPTLVITKNSGKVGGTNEKVEAAKELGIPIVLIDPPNHCQDVFTDYGSLLKMIEKSQRVGSDA